MPTAKELLLLKYKSLSENKKKDIFKKMVSKEEKKETELLKDELTSIFNINAAVISMIAAKNGLSIERMLYDMSSSWNKIQKIYPSESVTIEDKIYEKNIPMDFEIQEPALNSFKNKLLLELQDGFNKV